MSQPSKKMGLIMLTALVTGNMLGSGVFLLPSSLAHVGTITFYSWIITSAGALLLAYIFSRLSLMMPKAGGPYVYTQKAFGRFMGFQTAYCYWVAVWVGNAAIAIAAIGYARTFFPILNDPFYSACAAIGLVWLFTAVNLLGARAAGWVQIITLLCKLTPLLFITIFGWWYFNHSHITEAFNVSGKSNYHAISHGVALTLWAFIGVESATVGADRASNPRRNIPIATLLGTLIASTIYIASSYAIMGMLPASQLANSTSPFGLAAELILGPIGNYVITAGAIISCIGTLNGWILLQGQVAMNAAQDGLFPAIFAIRNKNQVPALGLIITSVFVSILLFLTISPHLIKQFDFIILLAVLASLVPYFYSAMACALMIRTYNLEQPSLKYVTLTITALVGIYAFTTILDAGKATVFYGFAFILTSFPLYAWTNLGKEKRETSPS